MHETVAAPLEAWGNFYVIVGSSTGALIGLQFVVMTLVGQSRASRSGSESISAFGTPNVVHFCAALLTAGILSVPWHALPPAGIAIALCGVLGSVYCAIVTRRARRQRDYRPVLEDWLWHSILPAVAYVVLFAAGTRLAPNPEGAMLAVGSAALLLVFIGIHNAWDTVTYMTVGPGLAEPGAGAGAAAGAAVGAAANDAGARGDDKARAAAPAAGSPSEPT